MTYPEFLDLVVKMRIAQRNYYKNRTMANLIAAKELERAVDAAVLALAEAAIFGSKETPHAN